LKNDTKLGKEAKKYIDKGELVPDRVTIKMLKEKVEENPKVKGYIFDGFPRTIPQSKALDRLLKSRGGVSKLLMLDVPDEELVKRLVQRGKTSGRKDDTDKKIIANRLSVYKETTLPVFNYYIKKDCSVKIWGVGDIKLIFERLSLEIDNLKGASRKKTATKKTTKKKASPKKAVAKKKTTSKKTTTKTSTKKKSTPKKTTAKTSKSKTKKSTKK
jgi:adenylate kinase